MKNKLLLFISSLSILINYSCLINQDKKIINDYKLKKNKINYIKLNDEKINDKILINYSQHITPDYKYLSIPLDMNARIFKITKTHLSKHKFIEKKINKKIADIFKPLNETFSDLIVKIIMQYCVTKLYDKLIFSLKETTNDNILLITFIGYENTFEFIFLEEINSLILFTSQLYDTKDYKVKNKSENSILTLSPTFINKDIFTDKMQLNYYFKGINNKETIMVYTKLIKDKYNNRYSEITFSHEMYEEVVFMKKKNKYIPIYNRIINMPLKTDKTHIFFPYCAESDNSVSMSEIYRIYYPKISVFVPFFFFFGDNNFSNSSSLPIQEKVPSSIFKIVFIYDIDLAAFESPQKIESKNPKKRKWNCFCI